MYWVKQSEETIVSSFSVTLARPAKHTLVQVQDSSVCTVWHVETPRHRYRHDPDINFIGTGLD